MNGYMNLARGNNMIGVATTNFYPIVSVSGSTATAPVTTTAKPVTTTAKPVTTTAKPVTTTLSPVITTITSAKPVIKACTNGSGYYLGPKSGCQKYYYCDDFYLYTYSTAFICGSRYILNQDTQSCVSSTSTCVTSSGICTNGSGYYNYPGCGSVYYCSRYVNQYTVPSGILFNPETNSFVSSSSTSFKCPF